MSVSQLAKEVKESPTLRLNETAARLREKGEPVIHLGSGEPKSKVPLDAILACSAKLKTADIRYTPTEGIPALIKAIRHHLVKPNLMLQASSNVVSVVMDEKIDEATQVSEVILGARVRGTGRTIGYTQSELRPDDRFSVVDILFFGTAKTKNVASKGPARVHSNGTTRIGACKRVWVDEAGLHSLPRPSNIPDCSCSMNQPRKWIPIPVANSGTNCSKCATPVQPFW